MFLLLFSLHSLQQCGCWKDWSIHNPEHCVRKNEIWRCCRHLPDRQNVKDTAASHGTDRGEQNSIHMQCWQKRSGIYASKKNAQIETVQNMLTGISEVIYWLCDYRVKSAIKVLQGLVPVTAVVTASWGRRKSFQ